MAVNTGNRGKRSITEFWQMQCSDYWAFTYVEQLYRYRLVINKSAST